MPDPGIEGGIRSLDPHACDAAHTRVAQNGETNLTSCQARPVHRVARESWLIVSLENIQAWTIFASQFGRITKQ